MGVSPDSTAPRRNAPADNATGPPASLRRPVPRSLRRSPAPPFHPSSFRLHPWLLLRPRLDLRQAGAGVALVREGDADLRGGDRRERHVVHAAAGGALGGAGEVLARAIV